MKNAVEPSDISDEQGFPESSRGLKTTQKNNQGKISAATVVLILAILLCVKIAYTALVVPTEIQQPGSQPGQVGNLESPDKCDNCHGGYNTATEPAHNWRGSMMANAGRDPIFWATLAVAEQDFDGAGDLCIRCHSTGGWMAGRSTPTDGSGLAQGDADGVECDFCHKMTNPDNSEHLGVQISPFIANDKLTPATGYYGSGMSSLWGGNQKLGPYADTNAKHQFMKSNFHRSVDYCGTCHDVSNPAVGDLAHNNGAQTPLPAGKFSGVLGSPVAGKAAFNNFPFMYGVVERTFSEHKSSALPTMRVGNYNNLPSDLKGGALKNAYDAAMVAGKNGDYEDGTPRYYSCQTCHMRPVTGQGCNKNPPIRKDLPLHDQTGGNYWMPDVIKYMDTQGRLRLGGGLTTTQIAAINAGKTRALAQLREAAGLVVNGNTVKVINRTGHKLISGYPEGRRMWLNVKWYDASNNLIREDGAYGTMTVTHRGQSIQVKSLLDLYDPNTRIYEAHYGMTREWAAQLISLGYPSNMVLGYNRTTGATEYTLGQLAQQAPGTSHETFHFVLNNTIIKDNRIPPYGFTYNEAAKRSALPVPANQYGSPGAGGVFNYWDNMPLNPPTGAASAVVNLMYQPTSWEYIQFLDLANNKQNAFLANEGAYLLEAWQATGMAEPYSMASTIWTAPPDTIAPSINSVVLMPTMVRMGDMVQVYVNATDNMGVTSVKVNGTALAKTGADTWSGFIIASSTLGTHAVTTVAVDAAGNTTTDTSSSHSYKTVRALGINNRDLVNHVSGSVVAQYLFTAWGRVTKLDADTFELDDGSGSPVRVSAVGHGLATNDYAYAHGIWQPNATPRTLSSSAMQVVKVN